MNFSGTVQLGIKKKWLDFEVYLAEMGNSKGLGGSLVAVWTLLILFWFEIVMKF